MKKTMLFILALVLAVVISPIGVAWAQIQPTQPTPIQPKGYDRILPSPYQKTPPPPPSKIVFITSQTYTGNLGGVPGADFRCQQLAQGAGLQGTYKAWLSTSGPTGLLIGPLTTFTHSTGPYIRVDGLVVANNWTSLISQPLLTSIIVTERRQLVPTGTGCSGSTPVWSAITVMNGTLVYDVRGNCGGWTIETRRDNCSPCSAYALGDDSGCSRGRTGEATSMSIGGWSGGGPLSTQVQWCFEPARLYCFQQ